MHTDEAVHAVKFGELLENNFYKYDPIEFHGPTLNYFTLVSSFLFGQKSFQEINEYTLRLVPAIISLLLIASLLLFKNKNNSGLIIIIALLITTSPIIQFYSRYYIQEILLITFTYSAVITFYKYFITKQKLWIITSAVLVGLLFATKETSIITFFSAIAAVIVLSTLDRNIRKSIIFLKSDLFLFLIISSLISILFYSSFFTNAQGIIDSISTFGNYFSKAGNNIEHAKPWYYYFKLMLFTNNNLIFYTTIPVFFFSIIGIYFAFSERQKIINTSLFRFLAIFSLLQAIIYSLISYKTPWLILNFWIGFLFLAGFGIYQTFNFLNEKKLKNLFTFLIVLLFAHNIFQIFITSFKYSYLAENPFTYSQPTQQVIMIADEVLNITKATNEKNNTLVSVIAKDNDYWPLPWYLRKLNNVAWNNNVPDSIYKFPIILTSPNFEEELTEKLYNVPPAGKKNLYLPLFDKYLEIRATVEIRGYVQKKYYDFYLRSLDTSITK
jgi:uncharacterized protein (TIGR03663 family)